MGTRALTFVYTEDQPTPMLNMYSQYDGYPSGHGLELAKFLCSKTLVNGFGTETEGLANGMGCLAAQLVAHFKNGVGGIYIHAITTTDCGQEFEYHVYKDRVTVKDGSGENLFTGPWVYFETWCKENTN